MILDKWKNRKFYVNAHPLFADAFAYIEEYLKKPVEIGTYEIKGKDLFVKVQDYDTRTEGYLEVHENYIDIQYMVEGLERVEYAYREGLKPAMPYDEKEDVQFFKDTEDCLEFLLKPGNFAIFFPDDVHKPAMCIDKPKNAKKIVFKVRV